jgi:hypothetical protein
VIRVKFVAPVRTVLAEEVVLQVVETEYAKSLMGKIAIRALLTVTLKQRVILELIFAVVIQGYAEVANVIMTHFHVLKQQPNLTAVETQCVKEPKIALAVK